MAPLKVLCVGTTVVDHLLFTEELPADPNGSYLVDRTLCCAGGKGLIPAATLRLLGAESFLISLIGDASTTPQTMRDTLLPPQLQSRLIGIPCLHDDNRAWLVVSKHTHVLCLVSEGRVLPTALHLFSQIPIDVLENVDVVYVSFEQPDFIVWLTARLAGARARIVVNPSMPFFTGSPRRQNVLSSLINAADTLIMNGVEAELLSARIGIKVDEWVHARRGREVIITMGAQGGRSVQCDDIEWQAFAAAAPPGPIVNPVGCGDAFAAGFMLARFQLGLSLVTSCSYAAVVAAAKAASLTSILDASLIRPSQ